MVDLNSAKWEICTDWPPTLPWTDSLDPIPFDKALIPKPVIGEFQPSAGTSTMCGLLDEFGIQPCTDDNITTFQIALAQAQSISESQMIRPLLDTYGKIQVRA